MTEKIDSQVSLEVGTEFDVEGVGRFSVTQKGDGYTRLFWYPIPPMDDQTRREYNEGIRK